MEQAARGAQGVAEGGKGRRVDKPVRAQKVPTPENPRQARSGQTQRRETKTVKPRTKSAAGPAEGNQKGKVERAGE